MKLLLVALLLVLEAPAALAECPQLYPGNKKIEIPGTIELCNSFFVTLFHQKKNASLLSSELLRPSGHISGKTGKYHADPRLYPLNQAKDYVDSGYERGQLTPASSATSEAEFLNTFVMSNMMPRHPVLESGEWRKLESYVRNLVIASRTPTHVVTGVMFDANPKLAWRIPVPAAYFKVLYGNPITVYYVENSQSGVILGYSIEWLEEKLGYKLR